ncbi:hypothetical protein Tsubulata_010879 [Turnera subulata]|uniref:Protein kinase domain-containing protein n=1 Tax=Turnera subulata TaxID=218843 RepID=A0A9Q0FVV1_9ROSI|nr:hypothetical protein Tsubulata_010879 [Turnera subulata]
MAPEVILQTGHSFSAHIWSVGCTVIEMATGKPPWSQQYQEVAALFHIGTTKSHPPIPEHLSAEAMDFLLKFRASGNLAASTGMNLRNSMNHGIRSTSAKLKSILATADLNKSFNAMCEPIDDWGEDDFSFPSGPLEAEDDDEVTESKIRAFLDEKALDFKKLQAPNF